MDEQRVTSNRDVASPFVVAHRAGNHLARLREAAALGLPLAEADVHLYRGRLEVRHLKTAGPLPLLWDRWELASARAPRMSLEELLAAAPPGGPELMLDLKGRDVRLGHRVLELAAEGPPITVCSQSWPHLEPFRDAPGVRAIHSIGNARALARLLGGRSGDGLAGVSIHRRLLDAATVRALRRRADLIITWPVETVAEARWLASLGVDGLISQSFETVATALEPRPAVTA